MLSPRDYANSVRCNRSNERVVTHLRQLGVTRDDRAQMQNDIHGLPCVAQVQATWPPPTQVKVTIVLSCPKPSLETGPCFPLFSVLDLNPMFVHSDCGLKVYAGTSCLDAKTFVSFQIINIVYLNSFSS